MMILTFFSRHFDDLRMWAGQYVAENSVQLAELLPSDARGKWEGSVQQALSVESEKKRALWRALTSWYLAAGPKGELPLDKDDVEDFKSRVSSGRSDSPLSKLPMDRQVQALREALRGFVFSQLLRDPDLRELVSKDELGEFARRHLELREGAPNKEMAEQVRGRFIAERLGMERDWREGRSRGGPGFSDGGRRGGSGGPGRGGPSGRGGMGSFGRPPDGPGQRSEQPRMGKPRDERGDEPR